MTGGRPHVEILEVGPRDGLQNEAVTLEVTTRAELVRRAVAAGLRRVEAVSFVRPDLVPQMAGAEEVLGALGHLPRAPGGPPAPGERVEAGARLAALVLNRRGLERAIAAGVKEVNAVVAVSDEFARANQNMSAAQGVEAWLEIAETARGAGVRATLTISVAFGCPFSGEVPVDDLLRCVDAVSPALPGELALADTIGVAVPSDVRQRVAATADVLAARSPETVLRCHFHNTRNTGYANAVAAVESGVWVLDASLGGAGGCPFAPKATGNIATEDLVYLLERMGYDTGVDLDLAIEAGRWLAEQLGRPLPSMLDRAGRFPAGA